MIKVSIFLKMKHLEIVRYLLVIALYLTLQNYMVTQLVNKSAPSSNLQSRDRRQVLKSSVCKVST